MERSRETTPTDQARETGKSPTDKRKRKWSPMDSTERSARPPDEERWTKLARTALEGSQEREKDDTALVLRKIEIDTLKKLNTSIRNATNTKAIFKPGHPYRETALSLRGDTTKVIQFREGKKNAPKPEEAYAAMDRLLTEVPQ